MTHPMMADRLRARLFAAWPRIAVTLGVLVPYGRLLGLNALLVTDDRIYSDVWNGELPLRALFGEAVRKGHWPVWDSALCGGGTYATASLDPISVPTFGLLPAVPALDVFILAILLLIAHSTYSLARALSASRSGALLAALAFTHSGYVVCQLKHLAIMGTIAWIPLALLCLERALSARSEPLPSWEEPQAADVDRPMPVRMRWLVGFGAVFGAQALAGFAQSLYIAALAYGVWALTRAIGMMRRDGGKRAATLMAAAGFMVAVGAAAGAAVLLPMRAAAQSSDRTAGISFEWASELHYDVPNWITFFFPYARGTISDFTYRGLSIFWEDYGYVGLATVLLAFYAAFRARKRVPTLLLVGIAVVAYLMVLGPATPLFKLAFHGLPGMKNFRFPTRFLVLVDLALALLGGIGLTELEAWMKSKSAPLPSRATAIAIGVVALLCIDLAWAQPRQNAWVDGRQWLAPPKTAEFVRAQSGEFRIWTPLHRDIHASAFVEARGWANLLPYFQMRDVVQPNSNLYWGLETADCYAGLGWTNHIDLWGDHNRPSIAVERAIQRRGMRLLVNPALYRMLRMDNVRYVLSPWVINVPELKVVDRSTPITIYEMSDVLPRIRLAVNAFAANSNEDAAARILFRRFEPATDVILHDAPAELTAKRPREAAVPGSVVVRKREPTEIVVETETTAPAILVDAEADLPGWKATIDGVAAPIYRANFTARAIAIPEGKHVVSLRYENPAVARGAKVTLASAAVLLIGFLLTVAWERRSKAAPAIG